MNDRIFLVFYAGMILCTSGVVISDILLMFPRRKRNRRVRHLTPILFR